MPTRDHETPDRGLAVVTGASSGIGLELARWCARHGFDLVIVADEHHIEDAAADLRRDHVEVTAVEGVLLQPEGRVLLVVEPELLQRLAFRGHGDRAGAALLQREPSALEVGLLGRPARLAPPHAQFVVEPNGRLLGARAVLARAPPHLDGRLAGRGAGHHAPPSSLKSQASRSTRRIR
jgi:hypothetical protein